MGAHTRESARAAATPHAKRVRTPMRPGSTERLYYRMRYLPEQLARARGRVRQLEREAAELGFYDLLGGTPCA